MSRTRLLLVAAVLAALTGAGGVRAAVSTVGFAPVSPGFGSSVPVTELPTYGAGGMQVVGYVHGGRTTVRLPLRNTGLVPVTVTSVALPGTLAPLLTLQGLRGLPVTLLPGATRTVTGTVVLGNCRFSHEREVESHDRLRLGVRVLGRPSTREVALARPMVVHSPMIVGCPDRKLNRQADNRSDLADAG